MTQLRSRPAHADPGPLFQSPLRRWIRRARAVVSAVVACLLVWLVLPPAAGGRVTFTIISGTSMEPTYHTYDLGITYRSAKVEVGDVIVYRVPEGDPGAGGQVVHRVTGGNGRDGWITQGDNREGPDAWRPKDRDVVGEVVGLVPRGGELLARAYDFGNIGLIAFCFLLWAVWPRRNEREPEAAPCG